MWHQEVSHQADREGARQCHIWRLIEDINKRQGQDNNPKQRWERTDTCRMFIISQHHTRILSPRQLLERAYDIHVKNFAVIIKNKNEVIEKVDMTTNRLYTLNIHVDPIKRLNSMT